MFITLLGSSAKRTTRRCFTAILAGSLVTLVACGGTSENPPPEVRSVIMVGDQENPAVVTAAIGKGAFTVDSDSRSISGNVVLDGMTATAAHIHTGALGSNGAIAVGLIEGPTGTWSVPANTMLTEEQLASFKANALYVNAHSTTNPSGEIRAQIGQEVFYADMNGAQEVPAVMSAATGSGVLAFDPVTNMLSGSIKTSGVTGTAAHIHTGAVGVSGGVTIGLAQNPVGSGAWVVPSNTVLTDVQIAALRSGGFYFNVHSATNPTGEIRGQIGRKVRNVVLNGAQQVPPNASTATGQGTVSLDPQTRAVIVDLKTTGVAGTVAHIHQGAAGGNGPVVVPLNQNPSGSGNWSAASNTTLSVAVYKALLAKELYFNVHSAAFAGGEIRGQIN